jgi:hypothetical protein
MKRWLTTRARSTTSSGASPLHPEISFDNLEAFLKCRDADQRLFNSVGTTTLVTKRKHLLNDRHDQLVRCWLHARTAHRLYLP